MMISLNPLLGVLWRGPGRVQIGVDPATAFIIDGLCPPRERLLEALQHGTDVAGLHRLGTGLGLTGEGVDSFLTLLEDRGVLLAGKPRTMPSRFLPVAASACPGPDSTRGWDVVARRRASRVLVLGAGSRPGRRLVRGLLGAGVGTVLVEDDPVGAVAAHPDETVTPLSRSSTRPDLAILVADCAVEPHRYEWLLREDVPHLTLVMRERTAVVGPFVRPGDTACLRCLDLYRLDRDPDWLSVLTQLGPRLAVPHDDLLVQLTTATACAQALAVLDGHPRIATESATMELTLTDPVPTVRHWPAHPRCGCTWELLVSRPA